MTINGSTNNSAWTYKLEASETSTSIANRTSTIQVKAYLGRANSTSYLGGGYSVSVTCDNQTQTQSGTISYPTYINGGGWLELKTFTFTVSNTGNPTTINISSSFSSGDFTPSSASANGSMQLTVLHLPPIINEATMLENNLTLVNLGVPDTTVVPHLSQKTITLDAEAYDSATMTYRLEHPGANYNIPSSGYQNSNVFTADYTQNDIMLDVNNKANIIQKVLDSLGGETTDYVYVLIGGIKQKPNLIPYVKPNLEITSTTIKRKSGNGTNLTDNKANLNLAGTIYKGNDLIGNNNSVVLAGYKIWEDGTSEPANYTSVVATVSGGNVTISNYEISNVDFTKIYNYKIILTDNYGYSYSTDGNVPLGQPTWSEYKDRVDFLKLTVGGYNPFEYNENEEIIIGIWNDGINEKPIYRKVITYSNSLNAGQNTITHGISNFDSIVNISGFTTGSSNYPLGAYVSGTYFLTFEYIDANDIAVQVGSGWGNAFSGLIIILDYTKSS